MLDDLEDIPATSLNNDALRRSLYHNGANFIEFAQRLA